MSCAIEFRNGALVLSMRPTPGMPPPPPAPLVATREPHIFIVSKGRPAGEQLVFELSDSGEVTGFSLGELKYLRNRPYECI